MPLTLIVEGRLGYDYDKEEFLDIPKQTVILEHCLLAIARWESKWKKSFFDDFEHRTPQETRNYIQCMAMNDVDENFAFCLSNEQIKEIMQYITDTKSATTVTRQKSAPASNEIMTSELLYYYMAQVPLPFEVCERWHLSRLLKILEIAAVKNDPDKNKKMSASAWAAKQTALNKARCAKLKTRG